MYFREKCKKYSKQGNLEDNKGNLLELDESFQDWPICGEVLCRVQTCETSVSLTVVKYLHLANISNRNLS